MTVTHPRTRALTKLSLRVPLALGAALFTGAISLAPMAGAQVPAQTQPPAKIVVPAQATPPAAPAATAPIPADCTQTADKAKAVLSCTLYLKEIGKAGWKDNDRMATILATRAAAYTGQGLHKAALTDVTRALYHLPKDAKLWHQRGQVRQALGQNIRCAADFSIALKYDPKMVPAYVGRSDCYRRLGALPKAITDADEALKLDPKSAAALATRGYAQLRLGKTDRALADSEEAIKNDPSSARGYLTRGLAQEKTDKAKADADVKKALALDPALKTEPGLTETFKRFGL